ncbi:MAG: POTRA domain-containing protein [Ekhidna sp.]
MIRVSLYFLLLFVFFFSSAQSIGSVRFEGLEKTKQSYLKQFLSIGSGEQLDSAKMEQDRIRLTNLEMFAHVHAKTEKVSEDRYDVIFWCDELFTLLPIFSFGGIEENFWIQAGISEVNLGGRGNKLTTYYQYYDRNSFASHLTLERIKQSQWGANIDFIKWSTLEPLFFSDNAVEYEYDNWTIGATAVRYLNFRNKVEFGGAFFTEDYRKFTEGEFVGAPDEVSKEKILGKLLLTNDYLDYFFFYQNGWRNQLNLQTVQSLNGDNPFYILFNDFTFLRRMGTKGNFASRLRLGLSSNEESPFAPFVLDSYVNIRGVGNRVDRGTGAIILNIEYRQTLCENDKIAIQGVLFSDNGTWRIPGGNLSDFTQNENFVLFSGGGLRFIQKKIHNAIFRIDYGFNLQDVSSNGFVLGIGQYF